MAQRHRCATVVESDCVQLLPASWSGSPDSVCASTCWDLDLTEKSTNVVNFAKQIIKALAWIYNDLLIMFQKSNRFSKGNEDMGLDHPRAFFTAVSWWQGQLTSQLLQECLPAMLGCSFSTANYQKSQSEIRKKTAAMEIKGCYFDHRHRF